MARHFNSLFGQRVKWDIGSHTATTSSNMTMACIFQRTDDTTFDTIIAFVDSGGTDQWWIQINDDDRLNITGQGMTGRNSTFTVRQSDGWVFLAVTKAAGTSTPRFHKYTYATDTWDHNNAGGTQVAGTAAGAGGHIINGLLGGFNSPDGYFEALAMFDGAFTDAQIELMPHSLMHWRNLNPRSMWLFDQSTVEQEIGDITGNGCDQIELVSTSVALIGVPISHMHPMEIPRLKSAHNLSLGLAEETDTVFAVNAAGSVTLGLAESEETALPMTAFTSYRVILGLVEETDYAPPLGRHLGLAEEINEVFEITSFGTFGPAEELNEALPIRVGKSAELGLVEETDSTFPITLDTIPATWRVEIDWEGDGDWTADWNNVTSLTLNDSGVSCEFGRDGRRSLSPTAVGSASLDIDNRSRVFSPENVNSPLQAHLGPARPIRIQANYDGTTYTLFRGITDDFEVQPNQRKGVSKVALTAQDSLGLLKGAQVTTQLWDGLRTDQALSVLLDHLEWPSMALNSNPLTATDVTGWTATNGSISHETTIVPTNGDGSIQFDPTAGANAAGAGSNLFNITTGREYIGSMWAYAPNGFHSVHVLVNWYTGSGVFLSSEVGRRHAIAPETWTLVRDFFNPPANAGRAAVWFWLTGSPDDDQSYYFWNVRLFDANDDTYRKLDVGASTARWWWAEAKDAFEAAEELVRAEGPPAFLHAGPDGEIVFRSRHHRLFDERSTQAQADFFPADPDRPEFMELTYDHGWRDVVNSVSIKVEELGLSAPADVWEDESLRSIGANQTLLIRVALDNPVIYPGLSYATQSGSATNVEISQLSGQTIQIGITAGGSGAAISHLVLSGQPVESQRSIDVLREEQASILKFGKRSLPHEVPWAGVHDAEAIGDLILGQRSERLPLVTITMAGGLELPVEATLTEQLSRDLSDRVHVFEEESCLDHDFFLESIQHSAGEAGKHLRTQFTMEKAAVLADNVFRFNDADHGFDKGVFAVTGLDEPTAIFVFDDPNRGFNDGVFAT